MQTYQVSADVYEECNSWPLTCLYCGGDEVTYSIYKDDARCLECGKWQLKEEQDGEL